MPPAGQRLAIRAKACRSGETLWRDECFADRSGRHVDQVDPRLGHVVYVRLALGLWKRLRDDCYPLAIRTLTDLGIKPLGELRLAAGS